MYVAVKGGERAIDNAHTLLADRRRGNPDVLEISLEQIGGQLKLGVDRVMAEGSLYDPQLAALAIKQAWGDLVEAAFLLRAYRTTLPRLAVSQPLDMAAMDVTRRISAAFKDLPGGQILGPTFDYTHRLLDFALAGKHTPVQPEMAPPAPENGGQAMPKVAVLLERQGLMEHEESPGDEPEDLTRSPLRFPASRPVRLQNLARADEGFLLAMGYSTQRGFGNAHPFAGEIRQGTVSIEIVPEELGFPVAIGEIEVTECEMITKFKGSKSEPPRFTKGYGLVFGLSERKAMSMALVDRALRARDLGEEIKAPAQDEEFVLYHSDNIEAMGFVQHLKLPHYVDFQSELAMIRAMRERSAESGEAS
jgi:alpha-D-ribose 1-methylphosphonate 5-triphosphate synthase subunit PhnI